eukprot:1652760-Prymnesium_polylepis.1
MADERSHSKGEFSHAPSMTTASLRETWTVVFADELARPQLRARKQAEATVGRRDEAECIQSVSGCCQVCRGGVRSFLLERGAVDASRLVAAAGRRADCLEIAHL